MDFIHGSKHMPILQVPTPGNNSLYCYVFQDLYILYINADKHINGYVNIFCTGSFSPTMVSPKFVHVTTDRTANSCFNIVFHFHTFLLPSGQTVEARDEKKKLRCWSSGVSPRIRVCNTLTTDLT